jgi:hypothetical protein
MGVNKQALRYHVVVFSKQFAKNKVTITHD